MVYSSKSVRAWITVSQWNSLFALLALCLSVWPFETLALEPSLDITQYAHTAWTTQDGALKGGVRCIAQSVDGYLWLGTEFGLLRFDGVRFVQWSPPPGQQLPSSNIRSLVAARNGTLWIGTLEGLAAWKNGRLTVYPEFANQNVLSLLEDREGTVWAGSFQVPKAKLCTIQSGKALACYGEDGSLGQWVWSLYEDSRGQVWAGAQTGLWKWKPGPPKRYSMPHPIETAQALVDADHGTGLLAIAEGLWWVVNGNISAYRIAMPTHTEPVSFFRDRDGGLWVGTLQRGLLHLHQGNTSVFAQSDGLSGDHVLTLFEDREGNVWVGTAGGLDRFRETSVFSISVKQGLSNPSVMSVLIGRDQSVWLSTLDGLNRWKNGHTTIYMPGRPEHGVARESQQTKSGSYSIEGEEKVTDIADPGLPDNTVGSLYEDERGRIWVSTPKGIARFENGRFGVLKEVPGGWVNAIVGDNNSGVWLSYQDLGLVHWADGKIAEKVPWSALGANVIASSVLPDPVRGGLWLGFFQGGLLHFRNGQVRVSYGASQGLGHGRVMDIQLDQDGTLWAATEGGLSHISDQRIVTLSSANGLPCDAVHWAREVDSSFWLYTACGLVSITRSDLANWIADPTRKMEFMRLGRSDGVRSRALLGGYTPRVSKSSDGRLWFANLESVSILDPRHLILNKVTPAVHIEAITADGKTYDISNTVILPPLIRDLTIDYTALSLVAPEKVRFRYKLEGQDPDWREVLNDRKVQYSNLPPGRYVFRVIAANNSGLWNQQGDSLQLSIAPAYWQTNWFRAGCVVAFLALIWAAYQLRVRQLAYEFNLMVEARVAERTRIARDLHDTLLQSLQGLLPRFQAAIYLLPQHPADARKTLEDAVEHTSHAITEGRDAVAGLRSSTLEKNNLALAIRAIGEELVTTENKQTPPAFEVVVEGTPHSLHPILRDEVYRVATEALRNSFRHAAAQSVEVEIRYDEKFFRLRVRDDGKGIRSEILRGDGRQRHYGLHGMRERAKLVGGNLTIWSELDSGTEIELIIPASRAYMKPGRRFWHRSKRPPTDSDVGESTSYES